MQVNHEIRAVQGSWIPKRINYNISRMYPTSAESSSGWFLTLTVKHQSREASLQPDTHGDIVWAMMYVCLVSPGASRHA